MAYRINGIELISNVNFVSEAIVCTAVLGANGAGKSLLLRLCHGLIKPTRGCIRWNDESPAQAGDKIGMVFQHPILLSRSVCKNVEYALSLKRVARVQRKELALRALKMVGLSDYAQFNANHLSGGQRQRLAIAKVWAQKPQIVLMDEPTSGIDMESIEMIEELIQNMTAEGTKVILTSHNPAQVKRLCDEVVFLDKGKIVCHTQINDFFSQIKNPKVRRFIESQTL